MRIGKFQIQRIGKKLWLSVFGTGEGMEVNEEKLEEVMQEFYDKEF